MRGFILREPTDGDMDWVVRTKGKLYLDEYGFDHTFEELVAKIVADFVANFDAGKERCWIAEVNGERMGCIFLVKHPEVAGTAKLRLLMVLSGARGLGLGSALVKECLAFARAAGYQKVVLWTQNNLLAARRIYEKEGFRLVEEEPHQSFGQDLIGQYWELEL